MDDSEGDKGSAVADPVLGAVSERIRSLRTTRGLSLVELAAAGGFTKDYLWRVEMKRQCPTVTTLARIALALDVTMSELLAGIVAAPQAADADAKPQRTAPARNRSKAPPGDA